MIGNPHILYNAPPFYAHSGLPPGMLVKRSRGHYLYCQDERRIFDMYNANGRLFYGHKPFQVSKKIKATIDQGLMSDLPHRYHQSLLLICTRLFPQHRHVYFFSSLIVFYMALRRHWLFRGRAKQIFDPAYATEEAGERWSGLVAYYRAALPRPRATILVPLLPTPQLTGTQLICSRVELALPTQMGQASAAESVAMIEALHALGQDRGEPLYSHNRHDIIDPLRYATRSPLPACWRRTGNYLRSTVPKKVYTTLYKRLLESDILINPMCRGITLLPPQMPKREYLRFIKISDTI